MDVRQPVANSIIHKLFTRQFHRLTQDHPSFQENQLQLIPLLFFALILLFSFNKPLNAATLYLANNRSTAPQGIIGEGCQTSLSRTPTAKPFQSTSLAAVGACHTLYMNTFAPTWNWTVTCQTPGLCDSQRTPGNNPFLYNYADPVISTKQSGPPTSDCNKAPKACSERPINFATGNKFKIQMDYTSSSPYGLRFVRTYNSLNYTDNNSPIGSHWHHNYDISLEIDNSVTPVVIKAARSDSKLYTFTENTNNPGNYLIDDDVNLILISTATGYQLTDASDNVEHYNINGQLLSITNKVGLSQTFTYDLTQANGGDDDNSTLDQVTDPYGRTLSFSYDINGRIYAVTDPADKVTTYTYGTYNNLIKVTRPDTTVRTYHYENIKLINALTGITDENNSRIETYQYNSAGQAISSEVTGGIDRVDVVYNSDDSVDVTDTSNQSRHYTFDTILDVRRPSDISGGPCLSCGDIQTSQYDAQGNVSQRTDFNGNITQYTYNSRNLELTRTEAVGKIEERTITTQWHSQFRLPIQIDQPGLQTIFNYDIQGKLLSRTQKDTQVGSSDNGLSRTTTYTYNPQGLLASIDGPRTDVNDLTIISYDTQGNRSQITTALGQIIQFPQYNEHGQPTALIDSNGHTINLVYDERRRLTQRKFSFATTNETITQYDYDNVGNLIQLTLPDNSVLIYGYDLANRLTDITDNLGNTIHYTLDLQGNRIKEESKDSLDTIKHSLEREYNELSQLKLLIGGEGQITRVDYDDNGNPVAQLDPRHTGSDRTAAKALNPALTDYTVNSTYDALNRLISSVHLQVAEDTNNPGTQDNSDDTITDYEYNALDQLTKVTDPNGLETIYDYNALGDLKVLTSPDTGITTYEYDEAGNRAKQTDARGIVTDYTYDALNRLKTISYPTDSSLNIVYTYDENNNGQNGIGHLTSMLDASGLTSYQYDVHGNLTAMTTQRGSVTQTIAYAYNGNDQLKQLTYPSGRTVDYGFDAAGRIDTVTTTDTQGTTQSLLANIGYQPFGPMNSQDYGNGLITTVDHDLDFSPLSLTTPSVLERTYGIDEASNIFVINDTLNPSQDQNITYDGLSRLDTALGIYGNLGYQYDQTNNRIQRTQGSTTDNYNYPIDSHRLQDINSSAIYQYDANGNTTQLPHSSIFTSLAYGDHNRLSQVNGYTYTYNGQGERVIKDNNAGVMTYYDYDQDGKLLVETDGSGNTLKEYVYANDQLIALIEPAGTSTPTETILDNPSAAFSDTWTSSTYIAGFEGSNYKYHTSQSAGVGTVGTPIDNQQASYTGTWPNSSYYTPFYGSNYQYHAGVSAAPGTLGTPLDNQQATYVGTWTSSTYVKPYYGSNYQYHSAGTGANTATWNANVSSTAQYDIYMTWSANANRADNTKVTIQHTTGSDTVIVNQQQNGGLWNLLGSYTLDSTSTISVNDDANGNVAVDAITILPAGTTPTIQQDIASWPLNISTTASYDIYATWNGNTNRATDAKYTVHHNSGSDTVIVNQQQKGQWNLLGTYTLDSNSTVDLSSIANGSVVADGLTVLPAGASPTVIPDGETATWTANQTGDVEVYAKWTTKASRASNAKYTINHSTGSSTVSVNQQQNGGQWNLLGTYTLDSNSSIVLSSLADGTSVVADAIRLVSTSSVISSVIYYVHNDHLGRPQVITDDQQAVVWQANYDPFGKATIATQTITNNVRFPGQYFDSETGLYYNYYRYYDPSTGRYITSDPIGLSGGINTYAYARGNPINGIDPLGLFDVVSVGPRASNFSSFSEYNNSRKVFELTPAGKRERKLWDLGELMQFRINKCDKNKESLQKKFDNWVVSVDPNIDDLLKGNRNDYAVTDYRAQTTVFNFWFFNSRQGGSSTFSHEFRHLMDANHAFYTPGSGHIGGRLTGTDFMHPGERDADDWASNFMNGQCGC